MNTAVVQIIHRSEVMYLLHNSKHFMLCITF